MNTWRKTVLLAGGVTLVAGCATREPPLDDLPPTAAGQGFITDDSDAAFYVEGPWKVSRSSSGFIGDSYHVIAGGSGDNYAVWNLETIQEYEVFARWAAHSNRASDAKFVIHHINNAGELSTETVTVNQKQNGGKWVSLGRYRMSNLTGRVTLADDANGYVVADAIRFVPVSPQVTDSDGDGMPDDYEVSHGLDPNDPSDAKLDPDRDGLTNVEEYLSNTDPHVVDAPDYERPDHPTEPERPGYSVTVSWTPPTTRENGEPLPADEVAFYEVQYSPVVLSEPIQADDSSQYFQIYGARLAPTSFTKGYVGSGYHALPPGNGETLAEWAIYELVPGMTYRIEANWTAGRNRSKAASYRFNYVGADGAVQVESAVVDQTANGGLWNELLTITPGSPSLIVELPNVASGYVIADALRAVPVGVEQPTIVTVDNPSQTEVFISGLREGAWQFQVRAVDSKGVPSRFSDPVLFEQN